MRDTAGEVGTNWQVTYSYGFLHMDEQRQNDQLEPTYNSSVPIQDTALNTYRKRWTIEKGDGRGQRDPCWWHDMMMMMMATKLCNTEIWTCSNKKDSFCRIQLLDLDKKREARIYKNIIVYFILRRWRLCGAEEQLEKVHTHKGVVGSRNSRRELTSAKLLDLIWSLNSHAAHMVIPLLPHNAWFSLAMDHTYAILILHWSRLTPLHCLFSSSHFIDFIYGWMYQSTISARFIADQVNILNSHIYWCHLIFGYRISMLFPTK